MNQVARCGRSIARPGRGDELAEHLLAAAAEEVYLVLSGAGRVKLGDEIEEIGALDAIRVAPA
jgi:mannose-6-phosphate isomerase-like protein (cupin superfamily)